MSDKQTSEEQAGANRGDVTPGAAEATIQEIASNLHKNAVHQGKFALQCETPEDHAFHMGRAAGIRALLWEAHRLEVKESVGKHA